MSIYGINNSNIGRLPGQFPVRDGNRTGVQPATTPAPAPVAKPANASTTSAASQTSVPADPPEGTDPALWSVLSSEERAFFAKAGAMGPLTYGKALRDMNGSQLPASRGGRLDVKG
jgi:hypothetical protein